MVSVLSSLTAPLVLTLAALVAVFSKRASSSDMLSGIKDGVGSGVSLLPTLIMLVVSVSMLSASGAVDLLSDLLAPLFSKLGIPKEILPLILMRPFSGSGSNAMVAEIFEKYGADGIVGRTASVLAGSSETVVYVISVYFSAVNVKKTRYALPAAFLTMLFCVFFSSFLCRVLFGY